MKIVNYEDLSDDYKETFTHNGGFLHPFHVALPGNDSGRYRWRLRGEQWEGMGAHVKSEMFPKLPSVNGLCEIDGLVLCLVKEQPVQEYKIPVSVNPELEKIASLDVFMDENPLVELQGFDLSEFEKREDEALAKVNNKIEFLDDLNRLIDGLIKTHGLNRDDWVSVISELKEERHVRERRWRCKECYPMNKIDL